MTVTRVRRLNVIVKATSPVSWGWQDFDVLVTTDAGRILYMEEGIYARSKKRVMDGVEWWEAKIFAERFSMLMDMLDQAIIDGDGDRIEIIGRWMEELKGE